MKRNKGITLITLMMYIIITLIVLGILGSLNANFKTNLKNINSNTAQNVEFDKLNVQLLKETKTENNFIETATATKASVIFSNGNKYIYSDAEEAVFLNDNIKIAENIKSCTFTVEDTDTEQVLKVKTLIGDKDQLTEYVMKKKVEEEEYHDWQYVDETTRTQIRCTCEKCKAFDDGDSTGRTLTIGQEINYTATGKETTQITAEKSGYTTDQTLTLSADETKWVVFGCEDKDNDGANEVLLLTTEKPTTNEITFKGAAAYNNCIDEINRMCKDLYGENARGMTVEDVNRVLGYEPTGGLYILNDTLYTTGNLTTKLNTLGEAWEAIKNYTDENHSGKFYDPSNPEGISDSGETLGKYELNGYYYYLSDDGTYLVNDVNESDTSHTIATAIKDLIFGSSNNYNYWLASRGVRAYADVASFGPGHVISGNVWSWDSLYNCSNLSRSASEPLRAVVSLTSEIPSTY